MTARTPAQFLLGTLSGTMILFLMAAFCIIFVCSAFLVLSEEVEVAGKGPTDPLERTTYGNKLWAAYGFFIDPGAQSGIESEGKTSFYLFIVVCFSLVGFTWVLLAFGVFIELLGNAIQTLRRQYACISADDHILVLGWTTKTLFLIGELAQSSPRAQRGGARSASSGTLIPSK